MRRTLAFLATSVLAGVLFAAPASAGPQWCEEDPVYAANGNLIDVTTTFESDEAGSVSGPVYFVLQVPANTLAPAVVSVDGTVPVRGYVSPTLAPSYSLSGTPAVLTVWMSAAQTFTTYTRVTGVTKWGTTVTLLDTVPGTSTSVQRVRFTLPLP